MHFVTLIGLVASYIQLTNGQSSSNDLGSCAQSLDGVLPNHTPPGFSWSGNTQRYYIAAEEVDWNFAPSGWDNYMGVPLEVSPRAMRAGIVDNTIYKKALYRGYTDETFTEYSPQPDFQGAQGPSIRAEVGDMIEIMFVNKLKYNYASLHSMGLPYSKGSEGGDYPNNTSPGEQSPFDPTEAVPPSMAPGNCVVYKWLVPELAGPNGDEPARTHSYHSYVDLQQDTNAGLMGPTLIYARGKMNETVSTYREVPFLFMQFNEEQSFMSKYNTESSSHSSYADLLSGSNYGNASVWRPQVTNFLSTGWGSLPTFQTINGYTLANNPVFEFCLNDKVIWYTYAYGSASHVFHMHGNSFTSVGTKMDAISINDGIQQTLYMDATGVGLWQVICHVNGHNTKGMVAYYRVYRDTCPLPAPREYNVFGAGNGYVSEDSESTPSLNSTGSASPGSNPYRTWTTAVRPAVSNYTNY